jgi:protein-disulfide isomerase
LQADRAEGEATQLTGTPTVFINGVKYMGGRTENEFFKAVDDILNRAE